MVSFQMIDDWLKNSIDVKVTQMPVSAFVAKTKYEVVVLGVIWRIMHLGAALLRAVRVPAFDVGQILELRRHGSGSSTWQSLLALPCIEYVENTCYTLAYQYAAQSINWLIARARTPANADRILFALNEQFVKRVNANAFGGDSTIPVLQEAWEKGIEFRHLGTGTYQLGLGIKQMRVHCGAIQFDSAIGARISANKQQSANLTRDAGLPAPIHMIAKTEVTALAIAHRLGWPVVVKPVDRERGEGVTVGIFSDQQLLEAFKKAAALSPSVLVERQIPGVCHRVLVVQGKVRIAAKRLPKSVRGDGSRTVRALVDLANLEEQAKPPWSRLKPFPLDEMATACLAAAGLTQESIPPVGLMAPLRPIQTSEWGGGVENLTENIHPENAALAIKTARVFGLAVAGIDIISKDLTRPWFENGAVINEVNFSPLLSGQQDGNMIGSILDGWLPDGGHIPVEVVIGGDFAMAEGLRIRAAYAARGVGCWLTSHLKTVSNKGESTTLVGSGLYGRCVALLMDPEVEALVLVIQTDELLRTGLPLSRIDRIHHLPYTSVQPFEPFIQHQPNLKWMTELYKILLTRLNSADHTISQRMDLI